MVNDKWLVVSGVVGDIFFIFLVGLCFSCFSFFSWFFIGFLVLVLLSTHGDRSLVCGSIFLQRGQKSIFLV